MHSSTKQAIAAIAIVAVSCAGFTRMTSHNSNETEYTYIEPTPVVNTDPYQMRSIKCADYGNDVEPCWTLEKGKFFLILSWYPKKAIPLAECAEEDGGPKLPCIWKDNNATKKKSDPSTRNIFFRKASF